MPLIGLLSDSHGRAPTTQRGVDLLLDGGAELLLHLGDVGTVEVIDALCTPRPGSTDPVPARLVFGNTDWDVAALSAYADDLGLGVDHPVGVVDLSGRGPADLSGQLVFCHGHEHGPMAGALDDGARYLCHGHTHTCIDERRGRTRVINPGALFRADTYTVALLNTDNDELTRITVPSA